jgi:hypothetical protein
VIEYTQQMLDSLISCEKRIIDPPKRQMSSLQGSKRNGMTAEGSDGQKFGVFMRISEAFEEDFSIGLRYDHPGEPPLILLRCNGPHGGFVNRVNDHPHFGYHIHHARAESIANGLKAETGAIETTDYASYSSALRCFLKITNIRWTETHFPGLEQAELFSDDQ